MIWKEVTKKKKVPARRVMKENVTRGDERETWRSAGVIIVFLHLKDFN